MVFDLVFQIVFGLGTSILSFVAHPVFRKYPSFVSAGFKSTIFSSPPNTLLYFLNLKSSIAPPLVNEIEPIILSFSKIIL